MSLRLSDLVQLIRQGGPGVCQIAVTNACNARCRFCSFPQVPASDRVMADPARLLAGLSALKQGGFSYLIFTGGEPLLYPELAPVLARARELGLTTLVCTNAALLTPARLEEFKAAGLGNLIISIDAPSASVHDDNRGIPGLTSHIREMLPSIRTSGLDPVASVTLSRLIDSLDDLAAFVQALGFRRLTFSYPLTHLNSTYLGFAPHESVDYTPAELDRLFGEIMALKDRSPLTILNPRLALSDLRRQLNRRPSRFPCLAGFKYFFINWHLEVHRCHFLAQTLGPLEDIHRLAPIRDGCTACSIDCYRDPSVYQYLAVSVADSLAAWRQGQWLKGLATLLHPYNALSLASLLEGLPWVRH